MDGQQRRSCDHVGENGWDGHGDGHSSPCKKLEERIEVENKIFKRLEDIERNQATMLEMMQAWNNTKGFISTIRAIGRLVVWAVAITAAWTLLGDSIRHWLAGK